MGSRKRQAELKWSSSKKIKLGIQVQKSGINRTEDNKDNQSKQANPGGFLTNINVYIIPASIEKAQLEIFKSQIVKNGGQIVDRFDLHGSISHIIVDDKMEVSRMLRLLGLDVFPKIPVVKSAWLSLCLRKKELVPFKDFQLHNLSTACTQFEEEATETTTEEKKVALPLNPPILNEHELCAKSGQTDHVSHLLDSNSESEHESSDDTISSRLGESTSSATTSTKLSSPKQISVNKPIFFII